MLALEITWVRGTAIVQTLFTCLYCHCPDDVTSEPLKLYLQALLKGCDATKRAVSKASVYEEEDFSVNMGGVPPPPSPPPSRTDWTRLVPPPVLTGHVSSLLPY